MKKLIAILLLLTGCHKDNPINLNTPVSERVVTNRIYYVTSGKIPIISKEAEDRIREIVIEEIHKCYAAPTNGSPYYIQPYRSWITNTPCVLTGTKDL